MLDDELAKMTESEDLGEVDVTVPEHVQVALYAGERQRMVEAYHTLQMRKVIHERSKVASEAVGNRSGVAEFDRQLEAIERQLKHCLRGIKWIDEACPGAKLGV